MGATDLCIHAVLERGPVMELIPQIAWSLFCIFFAFVNYRVIEKVGDPIRHGINGVFGFATSVYFGIEVYWLLGITMLLIARLVFDTFLNYLRFRKQLGLQAIGYVSVNPKSIIDRAEKKVFGMDGYTPKLIYLLLIIIFNTG
jgi:hypothetical protein